MRKVKYRRLLASNLTESMAGELFSGLQKIVLENTNRQPIFFGTRITIINFSADSLFYNDKIN